LLEEDMYYADGQVLDEVYVYGSFLQSKMFQAGVACTNCHQPHSGQLLAQGNALCAQCHQPDVFDRPEHHHHENGSEGAACVNCHMPGTTYMGVDNRRDHSFRVPEPQLTLDLGIPNACNRCHEDQDAAWAVAAVKSWYPDSSSRAAFAHTLDAARRGQASALPDLVALANDESRSDILRATAMIEAGRFPSQQAVALIQVQLNSPDPMMRSAAVRSMEWLPLTQRYTQLQPFISDPSKSVRMEVARQLASLSPNQVSANGREELIGLRNEYLETLQLGADMPEVLLNLGSYLAEAGNTEDAEQAYRQALKKSQQFVPAMVNLADLYRAAGLEDASRSMLLKAIESEPGAATAQHALGLLYVRQRDMKTALAYLQKAAELDPSNPRYAYVYGVALYDQKQTAKALIVLEQALEDHPGNPELISALQAYYQQLGETEKLQRLQNSLPQ